MVDDPRPRSASESSESADGAKMLDARLCALERLLTAASLPYDRGRARRKLVEFMARERPDDELSEFHLMEAAAEQSGLRARAVRLSIRQAVDLARQGFALAGLQSGAPGSWLTLIGATRRRVVIDPGTAEEQQISIGAFAERIGVSNLDEPLRWLSPERAFAVHADARRRSSDPDDDDDDHGHGGHGGGGHGGHGHGGHGDHHHPTPLKRLYALLRPEWRDILNVTLFALVVAVLGLATPLAVEALVNTVSFGRLMQPLVIICIILLGFTGFAAALKALQAFVAELIQQRLFVRIVADLAYRLPRADRRSFDDKHAPEFLNRFFDVMTVQKSAALLVLDGIAIVLKTIIGMAVLAFYHPFLLGFDIFLLAMMAFVVLVLGRNAVRTSIAESRAKYAVGAWLEELAQFSGAFKGDGGVRHAYDRADALTSGYINARRAHFRVLIRQVIFALGVQAVSGSVLLAIGGWLVMNGDITLGQLVAAELIVAVIVDTFAKLDKHAESFYDLMAAVDKVGHLIDLPVETQTGEGLPRRDAGIAIVLEAASYDAGHDAPSMGATSLEIGAGELVAISGPPGSGKSVLLDMLFGLRHATHGYITADGVDLRSLSPASYRRQVALVREVEVFSGTVSENVHLDRDGVDGARVREALQAVGLWHELLELPHGTSTELHPSGGPLSDSQMRRLVLARAFAGRPRLLLIDGLMDGLPDAVFRRILEHLRSLTDRCTVVIVTGREDLLKECRIVSFDDPSHGPSESHGGPAVGASAGEHA